MPRLDGLTAFLSSVDGYGYGDGSGDGYGSGGGDGYGDGDGCGGGDGYGDGVSVFNGLPVREVDGVSTVFKSVRGDTAKGFILQADLSLKPCFVAKVRGHFAHGHTLAEAIREAEGKAFEDLDEGERVASFWETFNATDAYPGSEFFEWHARLTGSCRMGREAFVKDRGVDLGAKYTVAQFVALTKGAYGSDVLSMLEEGLKPAA